MSVYFYLPFKHAHPIRTYNFRTLISSSFEHTQVCLIKHSTLILLNGCRCVSDVHSRMEGVLQHITTFKALAGIREAVHSLLAHRPSHLGSEKNERENEDLRVAKVREEWSHVCVSVLGRELCLWETFLRPLLLQRAKVCDCVCL